MELLDEGHTLAFDGLRVRQLVEAKGGVHVDGHRLAAVLHVFCMVTLQAAHRHKLRAAENWEANLSPNLQSSSEDESEECDPDLSDVETIRVRNVIGARSNAGIRALMKRAMEFSGLFSIPAAPNPLEDTSLQKPVQYYYRWPLSFVVRKLRRDWNESSDESSDGMSSLKCCSKGDNNECTCRIG
eukprot:TRINITY_DN28316_c0_g1_i2.p1 TRINITY_DN28316_c0_g1~~TRINITY_DN28316_c0_g1_i2.p1  ORF type:complete len:185 (+),score=34.73 TRINITY_DN28316_c0_g1_i2:226-780(+)